jgi:hypothetical protein
MHISQAVLTNAKLLQTFTNAAVTLLPLSLRNCSPVPKATPPLLVFSFILITYNSVFF